MPCSEISAEFYDSIFHINVEGVLFTVHEGTPTSTRRRFHYPLCIDCGSKGLAANSIYAATKAAVRSFVRTWTTDTNHRRIRVNAIQSRLDRYARIERPAHPRGCLAGNGRSVRPLVASTLQKAAPSIAARDHVDLDDPTPRKRRHADSRSRR
jgi:NAD(P)-dependent dehydrogenase (short-subunit alcohol dehydrogenase family)